MLEPFKLPKEVKADNITVQINQDLSELLKRSKYFEKYNWIKEGEPFLVLEEWDPENRDTTGIGLYIKDTLWVYDMNGEYSYSFRYTKTSRANDMRDVSFITDVRDIDDYDITSYLDSEFEKEVTGVIPNKLKPFEINTPIPTITSDYMHYYIDLHVNSQALLINSDTFKYSTDIYPLVSILLTPKEDVYADEIAREDPVKQLSKDETYIAVYKCRDTYERHSFVFYSLDGDELYTVEQTDDITDHKNKYELKQAFIKDILSRFNITNRIEDVKGYDISKIINLH